MSPIWIPLRDPDLNLPANGGLCLRGTTCTNGCARTFGCLPQRRWQRTQPPLASQPKSPVQAGIAGAGRHADWGRSCECHPAAAVCIVCKLSYRTHSCMAMGWKSDLSAWPAWSWTRTSKSKSMLAELLCYLVVSACQHVSGCTQGASVGKRRRLRSFKKGC